MSILVRYANFYAKNLGANNVKITRFHWSRKSRDSCPASSVTSSALEDRQFLACFSRASTIFSSCAEKRLGTRLDNMHIINGDLIQWLICYPRKPISCEVATTVLNQTIGWDSHQLGGFHTFLPSSARIIVIFVS